MRGGPHNAYLQLYSDTGVIGCIALILAIIIVFKLFLRILHSDKSNSYYGITLGITTGLISGGVHALVDDNMSVLILISGEYLYFFIPLLWLWAALLIVSYRHLYDSSIQSSVPNDNYVGAYL